MEVKKITNIVFQFLFEFSLSKQGLGFLFGLQVLPSLYEVLFLFWAGSGFDTRKDLAYENEQETHQLAARNL